MNSLCTACMYAEIILFVHPFTFSVRSPTLNIESLDSSHAPSEILPTFVGNNNSITPYCALSHIKLRRLMQFLADR